MPKRLIARLNDPKDTKAVRCARWFLLACETVLCFIIILKVPYTKIDWDAYMQQVTLFLEGERDYTKLIGETGPCVYPAGFLYSFSFLQKITGGNILSAQIMFAGIYLLTQFVVFEIYARSEIVPPWALSLLCLSKRIHSIYLLRLFNDCVAMLIAYLAILLLIMQLPRLSVPLFSLAVSVKMNVLLMAPSVLILLLQSSTLPVLVQSVAVGVGLQVMLALPFLLHAPGSYVIQAFDFSRVFLYKWTVNLKFVPETLFVSKSFAMCLLFLHAVLLLFFAQSKWLVHTRGVWETVKSFFQRHNKSDMRAHHVLFVIFGGNLIGILCARSLHYQFYVWYFHSLPFLLWTADMVPIWLKLLMFSTIEVCWNVFPSTSTSSLTLLAMHVSFVVLLFKAKTSEVEIKRE